MAKRSKGQGQRQLTPAELAALDFIIKDIEEQGEIRLVGAFWGAFARWALRILVRELIDRLYNRIFGDPAPFGGLSPAQMEQAEKLLSDLPATPSLAELKKVRDAVGNRKSK
jgi:hypothetical protein